MAISGMKKGVPKERHPTFVILTKDLDAWKKFAGLDKDEVPYLLLLDAHGRVEHRVNGNLSDDSLRPLRLRLLK